jgi:hypothetical protein
MHSHNVRCVLAAFAFIGIPLAWFGLKWLLWGRKHKGDE